jgi:hypothetical protein
MGLLFCFYNRKKNCFLLVEDWIIDFITEGFLKILPLKTALMQPQSWNYISLYDL